MRLIGFYCLGLVSYSHNSCFIISISYHFWLPSSFQFDLMFDTFFVSAHRIFSYHTFTQGAFGFNMLLLVQFVLLSLIVFFGILFFLPLCVVPCISFCFPSIYYIAYIHLYNSLRVERLYIWNTAFCQSLYLYKFKGLCL